MEKLIVIDSCMREESRTKVILDAAREVLSERYEVETIDVNALALPPLTPEGLKARNAGVVPQEALSVAGRIALADRLVIAAPFWAMRFRGMDIPTGDFRDQGSSYLKALSSLWGLGEVITVAAWNLDYMPLDKVNEKLEETAGFARQIAAGF